MTHNALVHKRIRTLLYTTFALFGVIIGQLFSVQVVRAGTISDRAATELLNTSTLLAPRGVISDINGVELARSVAAMTIVVDQTQIRDPKLTARITSPILNMSEAELEALYTGKLKYKIIVKSAKPAMWNKLQSTVASYNKEIMKEKVGISKRILGFFSERAYIREYPTGVLASSLIGFINHEGAGAAGIESSLNSELSGINGQYIYEDGAGTVIPGSAKIRIEAKPGTSIRLTVDRDIQWIAQDAISKAVKSAGAKSGTVIVMNSKTGAILAQASAPTYDPSKPIVGNLDVIRNPAVQDAYDPGSTGKVITYAAAIEEGKLTPIAIYTIPYSMQVAGTKFSDHEKHPTQRMTATGALAISSNTGAILVGQQLGSETLYKYLTSFGFGKSTGSHLPGESAGILPSVDKWSGTSLPTFSYGQGYSVTALQATSVFATIANDGVRVTPTIVAGTTDASGNYIPAKDQKTHRVVSASTAKEIRKMLESVVSANGTAPTAAIPGYRVAGKTGTANRYNAKCSCYSGYTASFIGFAPADSPSYVVSVTIQEPKGMHWGGVLGGPVFARVMKFVLQSEHIAPSTDKFTAYPISEAELMRSKSKK
jgi:cell division protein FtsI (penicillin-binding protein 3)